jgi:transposase-like protein
LPQQPLLFLLLRIAAALQQQYDRRWVNHQVNFVDPNDPTVHTQGIEATWGALKRSMKHLSGTSQELFPTYLFQYMFRRYFERKHLTQELLKGVRIQYLL